MSSMSCHEANGSPHENVEPDATGDKACQSAVMTVRAACGRSVPDFEAWCTTTGNELVEQSETDDVFRFVIRKK
mgnify:CR=1 FL=1